LVIFAAWRIRSSSSTPSDRIVGWLVDAGLDPNATDQYGYVPLLVLIGNAPVEALRALIAAGADRNPVDRDGFDVISFVANSGRDDLAFLVDGR
jgi:ankyrin repeat protein